ncbi:hypothetical protein GXM_08330 [Nostoc sphaeroides CCNUC1]|uniref:Uncharacterized protein n=1 Tax=Nostoc sphaeroides CCNUC1 TaxID=2653204 RepID=A0A5P8WF74_9NOSO|nr:hypothetical protein GXM_08330 [Nostoc sphaeroides CCNUC1]
MESKPLISIMKRNKTSSINIQSKRMNAWGIINCEWAKKRIANWK